MYKALNDVAISYIRNLFFLRATPYDLTTSHGLKSITRYLGPNLWNSLKDNIRLSQDLSSFKNLISKIDFGGMQ